MHRRCTTLRARSSLTLTRANCLASVGGWYAVPLAYLSSVSHRVGAATRKDPPSDKTAGLLSGPCPCLRGFTRCPSQGSARLKEKAAQEPERSWAAPEASRFSKVCRLWSQAPLARLTVPRGAKARITCVRLAQFEACHWEPGSPRSQDFTVEQRPTVLCRVKGPRAGTNSVPDARDAPHERGWVVARWSAS